MCRLPMRRSVIAESLRNIGIESVCVYGDIIFSACFNIGNFILLFS
jgi:hypothetical protein